MARPGGEWRESASLIVISKSRIEDGTKYTLQGPYHDYNQAIKGPSQKPHDISVDYDYKLLMMERSHKNKNFPSHYVFPGGAISEADFSQRWRDIISKYAAKSYKQTVADLRQRDRTLEMFRERPVSALPAEVAFRICAIRECFEECGLLYAVKHTGDQSIYTGRGLPTSLNADDLNRSDWRKRVHNDPMQFLQLCEENSLVPNIWALYDWSCWLTPKMRTSNRVNRFDTIFYICFTDVDTDSVRIDKREAVSAKWDTPPSWLHKYYRKQIQLITPQVYELLRTCHFKRITTFQDFAAEREKYGLERYYSGIIACSDGVLTVLPGDELYPAEVDFLGTPVLMTSDKSMAEMCSEGGRYHRVHMALGKKSGELHVTCSTTLNCGHVGAVDSRPYRTAKL